MKKNLFKVLFGVLVFFVGVNVHAVKAPAVGGEVVTDPLNEGTTGSVVVGEVATPVYEVNIFWDDLTFDWTYDYDTNSFGWKPASLCENEYEMVGYEAEFDEKLAKGEIYTDATCSTVTNERTEEAVYYAVSERDYVYMGIEDFSQNGQIVPSISWNAESNYSYTIANFEEEDEDSFKEKIISNFKEEYRLDLSEEQIHAWIDSFRVMKTLSLDPNINIIFEYVLPYEGGRRPDVILLSKEQVIVLEFKMKNNTPKGRTYAWQSFIKLMCSKN